MRFVIINCMSDLDIILEKIRKFNEERDWGQFHNPKDLTLSLTLEAAEVLEHFQWKSSLVEIEEYVKKNKEALSEEIADVAVYLLELADMTGIDVLEAIEKKMEKNAKKYPVEKARGKATKYTDL